MSVSLKVVYKDGVFRPLEPVNFDENQELQITIAPSDRGEPLNVNWIDILGYDPESTEGQEQRRQAWNEYLGFDPGGAEYQDRRRALSKEQHQKATHLLETLNGIESGHSDVSANTDEYLYNKD